MPASSDLARALLAIREHCIRMTKLNDDYIQDIIKVHEDGGSLSMWMSLAGKIDDQLYNTVRDLVSLGEE